MLAAPDGTFTRQQLRDMAPTLAPRAYVAGRRARGAHGSEYVRKAITALVREGLIERQGDRVVVVDRPRLEEWVAAYRADRAAEATVVSLDSRRRCSCVAEDAERVAHGRGALGCHCAEYPPDERCDCVELCGPAEAARAR